MTHTDNRGRSPAKQGVLGFYTPQSNSVHRSLSELIIAIYSSMIAYITTRSEENPRLADAFFSGSLSNLKFQERHFVL